MRAMVDVLAPVWMALAAVAGAVRGKAASSALGTAVMGEGAGEGVTVQFLGLRYPHLGQDHGHRCEGGR